MPLSWPKLNEIHDYIPASELGVSLDQPISALPLIGESPQSMERFPLRGWFKIGPQQYIGTVREEFRSFAWAASDGALAYILTGDPYFDDGVEAAPPAALRPDGQAFDWSSVVQIGRDSGHRLLDTDYCTQRRVFFGRFEFYYRHTSPEANEAPICIRVVPKVLSLDEAQLSAAPNSGPAMQAGSSGVAEGPPSVS
jgi:hypothetical protein